MAGRSEFSVQHAYEYNRSSPLRWIISHIWRYKFFVMATVVLYIAAWIVYAQVRVVIGQAAEAMISPDSEQSLLWLALRVFVLLALDSLGMLLGTWSAENIATRFEADAREELYSNLLGKSQAFHDRQRVGDIMARATEDTHQLSNMIVPGSSLIFEAVLGMSVPLIFIGLVRLELLLVPLGFVACYLVAVRAYLRRLQPVMKDQRDQYGAINAGLAETISGIEVVKASARELFERGKFRHNARGFRDLFVKQGSIEARYLPLLIYGGAFGLTFLHAMLLYDAGRVTIAQVIAVLGLVSILRFPTFISIFAFSLVQSGIAGAGRILSIIRAETDLDENRGGYSLAMQGGIVFENVSFGYGGATVLDQLSFEIRAGQTVAIVGQTGSGKSALTQLINRTYDVREGRVLIDGIDVRDWSLDALRSQISKIEQDVFLFSRTLRENIAFGAPQAGDEEIEQAARAAQAHDFIMAMPEGYETDIGERGVTLSGGQRQRIALARAFLSDPRVLILDDSTSAIDSATEDQIQKAIRRAQEGRTTILITHRLSQIRWADQILVLDRGRLAAYGTHDELLRCSPHYRRIFARYQVALPAAEQAESEEKRQVV